MDYSKFSVNGTPLINAHYVHGWSTSIFVNPKMNITCGKCFNTYSTRKYVPLLNNGRQVGSMAPCPLCTSINAFNIIVSEQ